MSELETRVGGIIGLLAATMIVSVISERIGVPYVVALLLASMPFDLAVSRDFAPVLLFVFLPALIFEAAWNVDGPTLARRWLTVGMLAIPGVLITAGFIGAGLAAAQVLPFLPALLLGAMLAATDPIAIIAVFRRLRVPEDLATIVEGESLLNDGAAIVLYGIVVELLAGGAIPPPLNIAASAIGVSVGGAAIGLAMASAVALLLRRSDSAQLQVVGTLVAAFGAYLTADALHESGIFATVVVGIAMRAFRHFPSAQAVADVEAFWSVLAFLANALVFTLMGLRLEFARILHEPLLLASTLGLMTAARLFLAYVAVPLTSRSIAPSWRSVIALSGMRGAISVALAIGLPETTPFRAQLVDTVFGVVFITLVVQGLAIGPVIARLRLAR